MIEQLFGSKTRVKLLQLFYTNPNRSFYVREITRKIGEQINSVRRELANLLSIGIISSDTNNNRLYYEVNQQYEFYGSLSEIFGSGKPATKSKKTTLPTQPGEEISSIGNIDLALYTGQFTRDESSGIDLLVAGDINSTKLAKFVRELESKEGKEIRYTVMTRGEFEYRQQVKDKFLTKVLASKKQVLVDKRRLLETSAKSKGK